MNKNSSTQNSGFVIHPEDFLKFTSVTASNATRYFNCCFVPMYPHLLSEYSIGSDLSTLLAEVTRLLLKRGIDCRFITEITFESLAYWKEFIIKSQIRHIDSLKASFALCDREHYWGFATKIEDLMHNNNPATSIREHQLLLYSNNKSFIEMQQFLFDNLWSNAVPVKQRIVQLERDQISSRVNLPTEPERIFGDCMTYLRSAVYEILVVLPNTEATRFIGHREIGRAHV